MDNLLLREKAERKKTKNDNINNKKAITRWVLCYAPIKMHHGMDKCVKNQMGVQSNLDLATLAVIRKYVAKLGMLLF